MTAGDRPGRFRPEEQVPPPAQRVSDVAISRLEHILEVDPELMRRFGQQAMPVWDSRRIAADRWDHLDDVHGEFADSVTLAGEGPETDT